MKALQLGYWLLLLATLTLTTITASPLGYCHDKIDGSVYPIVGTCTTYMYCLNENAIVLTCPIGQAFSQTARGCVTKAKSDCVLQTTTLPTSDAAVNTTLRTCFDNEQRPENQVACMGQPMGELMPYPGNCSRYLVCNCEYPTVMNCSGGLWFNNAIKVCDWPQNVNCNDVITPPPIECTPPIGISATACNQSKDGTLLRYPYNCNAYVNCTVGCPVLTYCDPGKVFNDLLKICDTPDTASCEDEPIPTTTPSFTNEPTTTTEDPTTPRFCTEPPFGVENYFCTHQPDGSFHNYPYNCTAYIECRGGCAWLDYCEPGKIFNNILDICDTPNSVVCHEIPYPGSSTTTTTEIPVTESTTTNANLPPVIDPLSCENRPDHTLIPYQKNCAQYIECMQSGNILHTCMEGTVFNPDKLICDQSLHDSCYGITTEAPTTATPSLPPVVYEKCVGSPKGTTYPYSTDCQFYYYCWGNSTSSLLSCPNNNYYNPYTGNCGPDVSSTACQDEVTTVAPTINPETICESLPTGQTYPLESNCAKYIMCMGGSSFIIDCPNNNYYNPNTSNCGPDVSPTACQQTKNVPEKLTALSSSIAPISTIDTANICENVPNFGIVPDTLNCSQFIVCMNKELMFVQCSEGEFFDPSIGNCDSTATSETCTNWQYTATTDAPIPPTTPPTLQGICGNRTQGELLAYPGNCTNYIVCVKPTPVAFACPKSWYFNEQMQQCDLPENAKCTQTSVTIPPSGGITTISSATDVCNGVTNGTTFPYTKNCSIFIHCSGNNFYFYDICINQGYYDPLTRECGANVIPNACSGEMSSSTPIPTEPPELSGVCAGQTLGSKIPYPSNCSKYIVCVLPIPIGYDCGENLEFNAELQECTNPENSNCGTGGGIIGETTTTESSATTAPKTCADLPNDSTLPYPEDCSKYIVCLNGEPMIVQCDSNSYYNLQTGSCDKQTSPTACQGSIMTTTPIHSTETTVEPTSEGTTVTTAPKTCADLPNDSTLPYPEDCSQYYVCLNGQAMLVQCMPQQFYNVQTGNCDSQTSETACRSGATTTQGTTVAPELSTTTNSETSFSTSTITTEVTSVTSTPKPCTGLKNGATLPYPTDCSKYIICINNEDILTDCMPNQYFNMQTGNCDSQTSETACRNSGTTTSETTSITETSTTATDYTTNYEPTSNSETTKSTTDETAATTLQPVFEQCMDQPPGTTFPHTEDCHLYYYCWGNNTSSLLPCPNNNYYNPKSGNCGPDVSSTACQNIDTTSTTPTIDTSTSDATPDTTTTTNLESTFEPTTENVGTTVESTTHRESSTTAEITTVTSAPKTCTGEPDGTTLPYLKDCSKYLICVNEQEIILNCMPNQYYNVQTGNCDSQTSETACRNTETTTHETTATPELPLTTKSDTTFTTSLTESTTDKEASTQESLSSTTAEITTVTSAPKPCTGKPDGSTLPYPTDCSKYLICVNDQEILANCMPNQYYNVQTGNCDSQTSETACKNTETTTHETTVTPELPLTTKSDTTFTTSLTESTTDKEASSSTTAEITTVTSAPKPCTGKPDGSTLPYPTDCSKYLICVNDQEILANCMPNQYYNVQTGNCDSQTSETACRNSETTTHETTATPELPLTTKSDTTFTTSLTESTTDKEASTQESSSSTTAEITTVTSAPKPCTGKPDGSTLPYPTDCSKYLICVNDQEILANCMPNQYYNVQTGNCDSQTSETACKNTETTTHETTVTPELPLTTKSDTTFTTSLTESTTDKEASTQGSSSSTTAEITTVTSAPKPCTGKPDGSTLPYPTDCSKYLICVNDQEILANCMPNQYYNVQIGNCDSQTSETACKNTETTMHETTATPELPLTTKSDTTFATGSTESTTGVDKTTNSESTSSPSTFTTDDNSASTETTTIEPIYELCLNKPKGTTFSYTEDCRFYYYCWGNNTSSLLACPNNNYYNPHTGNCGPDVSSSACQESYITSTTPEDITPTAAPSTCANLPNGATLPYPEDCSKYEVCLNGKEQLVQCMANSYYNIVTGNCDTVTSNTACRNSITTTQTSSTDYDLTTETHSISSTNEDTTFSSITTEETKSTTSLTDDTTSTAAFNSCVDEPNGTTLPDNNDCSKYIICLNGKENMAQCIPNTFYNAETGNCVRQTSDSTCHDTTTTTSTKLTTVSTTSVDTTSTIAPNLCTGITNGETLPYIQDCSEYIICWNDHEILTRCSSKTFYNVLTGDCDAYTLDTACRDSTTTTKTSQTTDEITSTPGVSIHTGTDDTTVKVTAIFSSTSSMTTNLPETTQTVSSTSSPAPNSCTGLESGTTLPYLNDCSLYIFCFKDREIIALCMSNTHYDIYSGYCSNESSDTACRESTTTTISTETSSIAKASSDETSTLNSRETTPESTSTISTTTNNEITSSDVFTTNSAISTSTFETTMDDTSSSVAPNSCSGVPNASRLPFLSDCSKYIICWNNQEILTQCMPQSYFNILTGNCDAKISSSSCRDSTTTTISTQKTDGTTSSAMSTDEFTTNSPESMPTTTEGSTSTSTPNACTGKRNGLTLPYPINCSKYIFCLNNNEILALCMPNTYYNIYSGNCNQDTSNTACITTTMLPESTTETTRFTTDDSSTSAAPNSCTGIPNGTTLPYLSDCSKYIICWNNEVILTKCMPTTYFNIYTGDCDAQISSTSCRDSTTTTTSTKSTDDATAYTKNYQSSTLSPTSTSADESTSTTKPNSCTGLESGVTLPYVDDCSLYIFCFKNKEIIALCMSNTYYDIYTGNCNQHTTDSACRDVTTTAIYSETTSQHDSSTTVKDFTSTEYTTSNRFTSTSDVTVFTLDTTTSLTTDETSSSSVAPNSCNGVPNGTSLPYLSDCSKYIICWNNQVILTQCMSNTFYNAQTGTCSKQTSNTSCRETTTTTTVTQTVTTTENSIFTTDATTDTTASLDPCYDKPAGYLVPYPNNCSKYIICNDPLPVGHNCPENLEFNADNQQCVLPDLANCSIKTSTTTTDPTSTTLDPPDTTVNPITMDKPITTLDPTLTTVSINICYNQENGIRFPYGNNCSGYIYCENGSERYQLCQTGYYYNPSVDACDNNVSTDVCRNFQTTTTPLTTTTFDPTESTSTTLNPHTPNVCCGKPLNTRVIYPGDCSKFITCEYPVPIVGQCPIGTSFDTGTLQCISSNVAQCRSSTGQSAVKVTPTTTTAMQIPTTTPTNIMLQGECSYLPSGSQLVYIGDCTKYNFCFGGQSYVLSCSGNFFFNPNRKQCVPIDSYKCPW